MLTMLDMLIFSRRIQDVYSSSSGLFLIVEKLIFPPRNAEVSKKQWAILQPGMINLLQQHSGWCCNNISDGSFAAPKVISCSVMWVARVVYYKFYCWREVLKHPLSPYQLTSTVRLCQSWQSRSACGREQACTTLSDSNSMLKESKNISAQLHRSQALIQGRVSLRSMSCALGSWMCGIQPA